MKKARRWRLATVLLLALTAWILLSMLEPTRNRHVPGHQSTSDSPDSPAGALILAPREVGPHPAVHTRKHSTIAVEVLDEHARPRAGVHVRTKMLRDWWRTPAPVEAWEGQMTSTDASGKATIAVCKDDEMVGVYDPVDGASATTLCSGDRCLFVLPRAQPLRVVVHSEEGQPVAGASVIVRNGSSSSRWQRTYQDQRTTNAHGVAEFTLPPGSRHAWIRAHSAEFGLANATFDTAFGTRTVVLRGDHDVRFRFDAHPRVSEPVDVRCAIVDGPTPIWEFSRSVAAGDEIRVGAVPDGARVLVVASTALGAVGHDNWSAESSLRKILLEDGCAVSIQFDSAAAAPDARAAVVPPAPFSVFNKFAPYLSVGTAEVRFTPLPRLEGDWRLVVWGPEQQYDFKPRTFRIDDLEPGHTRELRVRLQKRRVVTVEGKVTDAETAAPIPHARISTLSPTGPFGQVTDDQGSFRFETQQASRVHVFLAHERYLPAQISGTVDDTQGSIRLDAALVPVGSESNYSVTVRVTDSNGAEVEGALVRWATGRMWMPVGRVISTSERPIPVTRLPQGRSILRVDPAPGINAEPLVEAYEISEDREITATLRGEGRADLIVRIHSEEPIREQFLVHLFSKHSHLTVLRDGEAIFSNIDAGLYGLNLRIGGVTIPMGKVNVAAPTTIVERRIARIAEIRLELKPEDREGDTSYQAILKRSGDYAVIAERAIGKRDSISWMVPEGRYVVELAGAGKHGSCEVQAAAAVDVKTTRVALSSRAGNLSILLPRRESEQIELEVSLEGPVARRWQWLVGLAGDWTRIDLADVPVGTYELYVETFGGGPAARVRFDVSDDNSDPVKVHLK